MDHSRPTGTGPDQTTGISRRSLLSAGLLGAAGAALSACSSPALGPSTPSSGDSLVIGTNLELSGRSLVVGTAQWNGIKIVVDTINAGGFVAGGRTRKIVLAPPFDNLSDPKRALVGMEQLIANKSISVIVGAGSSPLSIGMAKVAEEHQVPMISLASAGTINTPIHDHRYVFRLSPNAADVAKALAATLKAQRHQRVALMYAADSPEGATTQISDGRTQMTAALQRVGIPMVAAVAIPPDAVTAGLPLPTATPSPSPTGPDNAAKSDMAAEVAQAMASSPDAIVVWAVAPMSGLTARSLRNAGYTGQLFFDAGAASSETLSNQNQAAVQGSYLVASSILGGAPVAVTTPAAVDRVAFYNTYTARYRMFDGLAPYGGDATKLIVQAVIQSGVVDREALRDSIEQISSYEGLAGTYSFSPTDHGGVNGSSLALFGIQHGAWVPTT
jgi:branched-chain amino acid transport system substrate-binding protein